MRRAQLAVQQLIAPWALPPTLAVPAQAPGGEGAAGAAAAAAAEQALKQRMCTPGAMPGGMPRRIEWLADVLVLPEGAFCSAEWSALLLGGQEGQQQQQQQQERQGALWGVLAGVFHAARVARGARIDPGGRRQSHLHMLLTPAPPPGALSLPAAAAAVEAWVAGGAEAAAQPLPPLPPSALASLHTGSGGWVRVKEAGLAYAFDATRLMFSSGNVSEKARVGALMCAGETVVDLFAGIGYFTLPCLLRAGAAHVHAAEWNPEAVACLQVNLALAGAGGRCSVWPGDNATLLQRAPGLAGVAHRVLLGLIPTSRGAWGVALAVLWPQGGVLHVHENVGEGEEGAFLQEQLLPSLRALASADPQLAAHNWTFEGLHTERVKSYAPRVAHFVFDVLVRRAKA